MVRSAWKQTGLDYWRREDVADARGMDESFTRADRWIAATFVVASAGLEAFFMVHAIWRVVR